VSEDNRKFLGFVILNIPIQIIFFEIGLGVLVSMIFWVIMAIGFAMIIHKS